MIKYSKRKNKKKTFFSHKLGGFYEIYYMAYEFADFLVVLYNTITLLNEGNLHSHTGHTYVLTDYDVTLV